VTLASVAATIALAAADPAAAPARSLDMTVFFAGRTHAENVLKVAFRRPARLVVDSVGRKTRAGDFILVDTVHEQGKPVRERRWVMRPDGPNRFTGTLSDAVGPVDVTVASDKATIRYVMKGGLKVDQRLQLLGDGRTLANRVTVKRFGLKFASVEGKIRKLD
jgi:hypothetical protein